MNDRAVLINRMAELAARILSTDDWSEVVAADAWLERLWSIYEQRYASA